MDWSIPMVLGIPDWAVLGTGFVGVLTFTGSVLAAILTRRSTKEANALTASEKLWQRVDKLDTQVQELSQVMSVSLSFIERLFHWGRGGGGEPEPTVPAQLRDRLAHLIHDRED